jgi:predicted GNAT superfamily acetyltransferase
MTERGRSALREQVTVRVLATAASTKEASELLRSIWRTSESAAPVNPELLRALGHAGNYVAGAYVDDQLVGVSVAFFTGDSPPALHSHITGIAPDFQGCGIGYALKQDQRTWALERGVEHIEWTMDPLVRRNAFFNLAKLGARAVAYLPDFYGAMEDGLNADDDSDRLLISWPLQSPAAVAAAAGVPVLVDADGAPTWLGIGKDSEPVLPDRLDGAGGVAGVVRCAIPRDITAIRAVDPPLARRWRHALRSTLGAALEDTATIRGVDADGAYVVAKQP